MSPHLVTFLTTVACLAGILGYLAVAWLFIRYDRRIQRFGRTPTDSTLSHVE